MQYKSSLLALVYTLGFFAAQAQNRNLRQPVAGATTVTIVKVACKDSLTNKSVTNGCPDDNSSRISVLLPKKEPVKPVPLAGQQSYFGPMNDYVIGFVKQYMEVNNKTLNVVNDRSKSKFSLMENVLTKNNIPKQLKYLAVIESALNNRATSHAGAVGPWQLMESTARMMGLTVNQKRDDRTDWYKSTHAAAKYLTRLYSQMNDWLLVIAAYNSGPTPVQRAIDRTGSRNFWDIKKFLPRETQGHVLAFIATATIFENLSNFLTLGKIPEDFKFHNDMVADDKKPKSKVPKIIFTEDELKNMAIILVKEPLCLDIVSQELNIEKRILDRWNPDYEMFVLDLYPEEVYKFRIPKDKIDTYLEKKETLTKRSERYFKELM